MTTHSHLGVSSLPPELIDMIVEYLHDDCHALIACSLTSKAWVPSSRKHLFGRVSLSVSNMKHYALLLFASPHLGRYVKTFEVSLASIEDGPYLSSITSRLSSVQELRLNVEASWMRIHPAQFAGIGPVRHLTIRGFQVLQSASAIARLLCALPSVKELELREISSNPRPVDGRGMEALGTSLTRQRLRTLTVAGNGIADALAFCFRDGEKREDLQELNAVLSLGADWHAVGRILRTTISSLERFRVDMHHMWPDGLPSSRELTELAQLISSTEHLQHLIFVADADSSPFLAELLSHVVSSDLRELRVDLTCYDITVLSMLEKLSRSLSDIKRFPTLDKCKLVLEGYPVDSDPHEFIRTVQDLYAPLESRRIMVIIFD